MSRPLLLVALPGNEAMAALLGAGLNADSGALEQRSFPDGETYLRFLTEVAGRDVALVCTLDHPDGKLLPLLFAAAAARDLGAARVGLVAPYLAYMRQDRRFTPGEAVTSRHFADLISGAFDWLVTVDPHLHRYRALAELYRIPTRAVHAAPPISRWIEANVRNPLVIGPDSESEQWVGAVARAAGAPFTVLEKHRRGDRDVDIALDRALDLTGRTPVLVDDIISSGRTMLQTIRLLGAGAAQPPVCVGVHGIFADNSDRMIADAGARLVTCNTIAHPSNAIDVHGLLVDAIEALRAAP